MDLLFGLIFSFLLLIISVTRGVFIAYPLLLTLVILITIYILRVFPLKSLIQMALLGSKTSFPVLSILLLFGSVTAAWIAAGTIPSLVYYGIKLINPQYFILSAFILNSFVSILTGTSFGTVSTIGIPLMIMAKGSNINIHMIAGAIIAGAYFGERCSPMSSSAHLIASLTPTKIYTNIKNLVITAMIPLIISVLAYLILSKLNPVHFTNSYLTREISKAFTINGIVLLPALTKTIRNCKSAVRN